MGVLEKVLTKPAPALTKSVQAEQSNVELPDNGGSAIPAQNLPTTTYLYRVNVTGVETLSRADLLNIKEKTAPAIEKTHNAIPLKAVVEAYGRSENKDIKIKRVTTEIELRELMAEWERVKSNDWMWVVYNVKNGSNPQLVIEAGKERLQLQSGQEAEIPRQLIPQVFEKAFEGEEEKLDSDAGVLMKAEELRMLLGAEVSQSLISRAMETNGVIEIMGVYCREKLEAPKLGEPQPEQPQQMLGTPQAQQSQPSNFNYILGGNFSYEDLSKN